MTPRVPRATEAGFGLAELLVALAVLGGLLLMVFSAFFRTNDASSQMHRLIEFRQSARASVQLIERDLRMSGSGWGRMAVDYSDNGTPQQLFGITPGPGTGHSDSLVLAGAWSTQTTLENPMSNPSALIRVTDIAGFAVNDLIVVTNGSDAHLFQVTNIQTGPARLAHATSSPFNVVAGFANWPAGGYGVGSIVYRVGVVTYRVDSTSFGRPCLVRQEFGGQPQVVAYDLNKFQMWYRMHDSTTTRDPAAAGGIDFMDKIIPRIYVRVMFPRKPTLIDSVWAEVRPRTF